MGPLGWQETVFIFLLALLIFGPKKLPELGKTIGKAMTEFRRASSELKSTWDREMSAIEQEKESLQQVSRSYENEINNNNYDGSGDYGYNGESYDSPYDDSGSYGTKTAESKDSTAPADEGTSDTVSASATQDADTAAADTQTAAGEGQAEETAVAEAIPPVEGPGAAADDSKAVRT